MKTPPRSMRGLLALLACAAVGSAVWLLPVGAQTPQTPQSRPASRPSRSLQQDYQRRLSGVGRDDANGHLALAEWCLQNKLHEFVLREAQTVLRLRPEQMTVQQRGRRIRERGAGAEDVDATGEYLTASQIQRLRFAELLEPPSQILEELAVAPDPAQLPPGIPAEFVQVHFGDNVLRDFLADMSGHKEYATRDAQNLFMRLRPTYQLQLIRNHTGPRYAQRIQIASDPLVFRQFRRTALPLVLNGCATSACHGGLEAKHFRIRTGRLDSDENLYTNFLILNRVRAGRARVIDRVKPENSLLLQFGLPMRAAERHHPIQIEPLYPMGIEDPRYQAVRRWIDLLTMPEPRTGVSLPGFPEPAPPGTHLGGTGPATQPAVR